jgi:hypothetical protein
LSGFFYIYNEPRQLHMRTSILFFIMSILFLSCSSTEKLLSEGQYDRVIDKSVKKLSKKENNDYAKALDKAYKLANEKDQDYIDQLLKEDNEQNWERIMKTYQQLNRRQDKIKRVSPFVLDGQQVKYNFVNYNDKIANAKSNAAEYFYNNGVQLMDDGNKESYRNAHFNFQKAQLYAGSKYPNINMLISETLELGTTHVLVSAYNETGFRIHPQYLNNAASVNKNVLKDNWVKLHFDSYDNNLNLDYEINLIVNEILVSNNSVEENDHRFKKRVESGFEYVLDDNGNVMKDSLGNDIKVIRYADISCTVVETRQFKTAKVIATGEIVDLSNKTVVATKPLRSETMFEHFSARAIGEKDALPVEWLDKIRVGMVPFPSDEDLVMDTSDQLQGVFADFIRDHNRYIY